MMTRLLDMCKMEPTVPLVRKITPFSQGFSFSDHEVALNLTRRPCQKVADLPHVMSPLKQVQLDVNLSEWVLFSHCNTSRMFHNKKNTCNQHLQYFLFLRHRIFSASLVKHVFLPPQRWICKKIKNKKNKHTGRLSCCHAANTTTFL